ncbi:site-specific recombinase [Leptothrix ochracea]|uniref:site-specific recombinase n=1 Tax=Leptothrix ochracea TaxID=735331 RepID=UPI0034E1FA6F
MASQQHRWLSLSRGKTWDLTALLNAVDPHAPRAERHLWLVRLMEWLRHDNSLPDTVTPVGVLRLRHFLNVLERNPSYRAPVAALLQRLVRETEVAALFADLGFSARRELWGDLMERLRMMVLPDTPDSTDLAQLFSLFFSDGADAQWLRAIDDQTLQRLAQLFHDPDWHQPFFEAITYLVSAIRAAAFLPALRRRMDGVLLAERPFEELVRASETLVEDMQARDWDAADDSRRWLDDLLADCREAAASVHGHLEAYGISVDLMFELEQLRQRTLRIEALTDAVLAKKPERALLNLVADLVEVAQRRRSLRAPLSEHYALLARKIAERSAASGEHYITRTRAEYGAMLRSAAGGGVVIAGTTFMKFLVLALGLPAFWAGFWAGMNYAGSFVLIHLLHWTVATKQPAMTAPAMAAKLGELSQERAAETGPPPHPDPAVEGFIDEVTHLIRSQIAGIVGNLMLVAPVVLGVQLLARWLLNAPLVGVHDAEHVLHSLTLLGPTLIFAAFTGVLLFISSLIAGWVENWFVWHRLDSAIAWNPRFVAVLGASRAQRWSRWWRDNISGLAANVSLGLLLGVVPVLGTFFGLPIEVRHVTLSTGQLAAALGAMGTELLYAPEFWWCMAAIPFTGALNLLVSFTLAFRVALRSRGLLLQDRGRLYAALRQRLRQAPGSFLVPPAG